MADGVHQSQGHQGFGGSSSLTLWCLRIAGYCEHLKTSDTSRFCTSQELSTVNTCRRLVVFGKYEFPGECVIRGSPCRVPNGKLFCIACTCDLLYRIPAQRCARFKCSPKFCCTYCIRHLLYSTCVCRHTWAEKQSIRSLSRCL